MNPPRKPAPWILPALCCGWMSAAGQQPAHRLPDDGGVQQWTDPNGRSIQAHFKRISDRDVVVVDNRGVENKLPVARLSQASVLQAKALSAIIDVFLPVGTNLLVDPDDKLRERLRHMQAGANRFTMGSPGDEPGRENIETPHLVRLASFEMKATEVTWTEWNAVRNLAADHGYNDMSPGGNGTAGLDADLNPVVGITWWDALKWCNLKSQLEKRSPAYLTADGEVFRNKTGKIQVDWSSDGYRLPTEAEWEFACRGRRSSPWAFHTGQIDKKLDRKDRNMGQAGWYVSNSGGCPHPVAEKGANSLKLYDMHGNAAEWCWDVFSTLEAGEAIDPRGPDNGEFRIVRGGSWSDPARACRAAARGHHPPGATPDREIGFRPVRPVPPVRPVRPR